MADDNNDRETTLEIELDGARKKHLLWAVVGVALGIAVALYMGSSYIGWVIGAFVFFGGVKAGWAFGKTLLHPPGTIVLDEDAIVLPEGISTGASAKLLPNEVRNAYVLRRALPWSQSGPLLVVETRRGTFEFPREWFAGDGDQRRVAAALNRRLGRIP